MRSCVSWRLVAIALALCIPAGSVRAWTRPGHMVSGAIAYAELKKAHPDALARVVALFKQHPHYETKWLSEIRFLPAADHDVYLFMAAARWPDDVRGDPIFHPESHDRWHGIRLPYKPGGQPPSVKTKKPSEVNILTTFPQNEKKVRSSAAGRDRAVALCWIFHQVGDVHQPLHAVTLYSAEFPNGDRSATAFYIRAKPGTETVSLHGFWDNLVQQSNKASSVMEKAKEIRDKYPRRELNDLKHVEFSKWADESHELARKVAYRLGRLHGSSDEQNGAVLPADYVEMAEPVAQRRVALAGYRLADLLQQWFK